MDMEFRNFDMFKVIEKLYSLLAEQEGAEITCTLERDDGVTKEIKTA